MKIERTLLLRHAMIVVAAALPIGAAIVAGAPAEAIAGCQITVSVHNTGTKAFTVDWDESKVKTSGGTWTKLANNSSESVGPGQTKSTVYGALFNCGADRRYQIHTSEGGSSVTTYFPGVSSWTTDQTPTVNVSM